MSVLRSRLHRRDPYWGEDGQSARRERTQRRAFRFGLYVLIVLFVGVIAVNLPTIDPATFRTFVEGPGRPLMVGSMLLLLAACVLVGLAKLRTTSQ